MPVYNAKSIPAEVHSSTKDPEVAAFLKTGPVLGAHKPIHEQRVEHNAFIDKVKPPIGKIEHLVLDGPHGSLPVRVYYPSKPGPAEGGALIYVHGGGFIVGTLDQFDTAMRLFSEISGAQVYSVNYKLAPEYQWPTQIEEVEFVVRWLFKHASKRGLDPNRIGLGGDSAGGNITCTVCLKLRDENGPKLALQMPIYPEAEMPFFTRAVVENVSGGYVDTAGIVFLQGVANILGMAIERQRMEVNLRQAIDRQQLLLKEVNHRVNNSLQIVAAMLHLQSSHTENSDVRNELREAGTRIAAVARAHQKLYISGQIETLDLGIYLTDVCKDITASISTCEINVSTEQGIVIPTDRAITIVLLVNELVTNAIKHAYPQAHCRVWVTLSRKAEGGILVSVRDEGVGLAANFDVKTGRRLGLRLVRAFTEQLRGELQVVRREPGTEFAVTVPTNGRL